MRWGAIVVAAGKGHRFGRPKQLVDLAGRPVVAWSIALFAAMPEVNAVVVVAEESEHASFSAILDRTLQGKRSFLVPGGQTRQASVYAGLRALHGEVDAVLVHDGARPLLRAEDARRCMRGVANNRAAILAVPVADTVKTIDERGHVRRTLERSSLWAAQTPQCAMFLDLERAHREADREAFAATDDAGLLERIGVDVVVVPGESDNLKITVQSDLLLAQAIMRERDPVMPDEEQMYLLEAFVPSHVVDAMIVEIEANDGDVDGIDRDMPQGVAVRAYLPSSKLERFRARFHVVAGHDATYTTRYSHGVSRV